jgi:hypothetical protein
MTRILTKLECTKALSKGCIEVMRPDGTIAACFTVDSNNEQDYKTIG